MSRKKKGDSGYSGFNLAIGHSYKAGWDREENPVPSPDHECSNCKRKGHCWFWKLSRIFNAFGKLIKRTQSVYECQYCHNEEIVGSMEFFEKPNKLTKTRKFNIRKLSPEDRKALMAIVEREIREGRIK